MRSVPLLLAGCVIGVMVLTTSFEGQERTITIHVGTLLRREMRRAAEHQYCGAGIKNPEA